jgi:hypothetical protein
MNKNIIITEDQINKIYDNKYVKKYPLSYIDMLIVQLQRTNGSGLPKNKTIFNILENVKKRGGYITERENNFLLYILEHGFNFK